MTSESEPQSGTLSARRSFAVNVVQRLRDSGFEALWAGGCVRDQLLNKPAKDFDVATTARPEQVIELFGERRTVPVGASFGVVMVLGPSKASGQIEVATFRSDGAYMDGRRPVGVRYCGAQEDALRRDFTINGMFYDPIAEQLIDYVGGQADIRAKVIRAIGNARDRFTEDKLRMLRAIRFAATLSFEIESDTFSAIQLLHQEIVQVSVERIAQEFRRMLADASRVRSTRLLRESGLLTKILPEASTSPTQLDHSLEVMSHLREPFHEPSLAALLLRHQTDSSGTTPRQRQHQLADVGRRLKLSNDEIDTLVWLADSCPVLRTLPQQSLHITRPLLADPRIRSLIDLSRAEDLAAGQGAVGALYAESLLQQHPEYHTLPPALVTGKDLIERGIPSGPQFKTLLSVLRNEQLNNQLLTRDQALQRLQQLLTPTPE